MSPTVKDALSALIVRPSLTSVRQLEAILRAEGCTRQVFGRINQKSSIEAASESDRGITERLANAFDTSLTAARLLSGIVRSDPSLTPRVASKRFFCANDEISEWQPTDSGLAVIKRPVIEFWPEPDEAQRFRKHRPADGLVTVLVQDSGTGIRREQMPQTILTLNSESKLKQFEAIGQFGHGGSSALAFCESCLILTQAREGTVPSEFAWTIIVPEKEEEESKQPLIRRWFAESDGLPLRGRIEDFPTLAGQFPGTLIWHFGYNRGGWIKRIAGSDQTNPWGRLGRLFFSYPLPFEIRGEYARADSATGHRLIKGAFYRIAALESDDLLFRSGEKEETLIVAAQAYGTFSVRVYVFKDSSSVRNYVEPKHPVLLTLNGQNHGELTRTLIDNAGLPEISSKAIIEVRLDRLDQEALAEIISNSREMPKNTDFTRALKGLLEILLRDDQDLQQIERRLEEEKARQSSADLSRKMSEFLSRILSDASGGPDVSGGGDERGEHGEHRQLERVPVAPNDPPQILEFVHEGSLFVAEGGRALARFKSDARPPKYSFHGDNPRCFARIEGVHAMTSRLRVVGHGDISDTGYGTVSISCNETEDSALDARVEVGQLVLTMQATDGRTLEARLTVGIKPKPTARQRAARQEVRTNIIFCAPEGADTLSLASILGEANVAPFGTGLEKYRNALSLPQVECTYWGDKSERDGVSHLTIEINVANEQLQALFRDCRDVAERIAAKERYVRDVVLDCYQHSFLLADTPARVTEALSDDVDESRRAADIHFNHDKAVRIARHEMLAER